MAAHNELGKQGEESAARYLESKGYVIVDRNWRSASGNELDIVARKDQDLIFVEVRTRAVPRYGDPYQSIDMQKAKRLVAAAEAYLDYHDYIGFTRFDVVSVIGADPPFQIQHIEDAFDPHFIS